MNPRRACVMAAVGVALCAFALWWWREARDGARAMLASDAALAGGDTTLAIERAREAAQHPAPFGSAKERGFQRLQSIADDAESHGDVPTMKAALLAMRSAADSTDDATWRSRANAALPRCAMRAEANPSLHMSEGCQSAGDASCVGAMKLELATPTHPPPTTHLVVALFALALGALAMRLTRREARLNSPD